MSAAVIGAGLFEVGASCTSIRDDSVVTYPFWRLFDLISGSVKSYTLQMEELQRLGFWR